jgi:hypothetical protein
VLSQNGWIDERPHRHNAFTRRRIGIAQPSSSKSMIGSSTT